MQFPAQRIRRCEFNSFAWHVCHCNFIWLMILLILHVSLRSQNWLDEWLDVRARAQGEGANALTRDFPHSTRRTRTRSVITARSVDFLYLTRWRERTSLTVSTSEFAHELGMFWSRSNLIVTQNLRKNTFNWFRQVWWLDRRELELFLQFIVIIR